MFVCSQEGQEGEGGREGRQGQGQGVQGGGVSPGGGAPRPHQGGRTAPHAEVSETLAWCELPSNGWLT